MLRLLAHLLPVFLIGSVLLFLVAVTFGRRHRQWPGFLLAVAAVPLFATYYNDQEPFLQYSLRSVLDPLATMGYGDSGFQSDVMPAALAGGLYFARIVVYFRLVVRRRRNEIDEKLQRVNDRVGNFFAYTTVAILLGGIIVSTFSLGWMGSLSVTGVFVLLYLGVIGIFADGVKLGAALGEFGGVWTQRRLGRLIFSITRSAVWVANLYRAIRPNLRNLITRVRAATGRQRAAMLVDTDKEDVTLANTGLRPHDTVWERTPRATQTTARTAHSTRDRTDQRVEAVDTDRGVAEESERSHASG